MSKAYLRKRLKPAAFLALLLVLPAVLPGCGKNEQGNGSAWKFAVISDTQADRNNENRKLCINGSVVKAIAADVAGEKPDFVLVSGDLVSGWFRNGGTDYPQQYANWKKAMAPVYSVGIKVYPIRGNHDDGPERVALPPLPARFEPPAGALKKLNNAYREAINESYIPENGPAGEKRLTYSFTHKNAFIIALDEYTGGQHGVNQKWLDSQLASNTKPLIIVYGHEPAFEAKHRDNLSYYPKKRDVFWDSIGRAGGRIYFCGHDHLYNRALIKDSNGNPIWQIIAGTGGGGLKDWSGKYGEEKRVVPQFHLEHQHGYIVVSVDGSTVTVNWKALTESEKGPQWKVMDTFSYSVAGNTVKK